MSNFVLHIGISLLAGMVGGGIFFILIILSLSQIKPELRISRYIAKSVHQGVARYDFKIINCSSRRAVKNISVEFILIKNNESESGSGNSSAHILSGTDIYNSNISSLDKYNKHDKKAGYTGRVSTHLNLDELLATGNLSFQLSVTATDSFSGVTKVFVQTFSDKSLIKLGLHELGVSVNVSPQPNSSIQSVI
ncbi:hypothetical protein AB7M29_002477 [Pseudomonas sp. F-14 TE3623]